MPEPEKFTFEFTEYELEQLVWLWCGHKQMNTLLGDMIKPLETIGSYFTGYGDVVIQLVKVTAERDKCASQVDNLNKWINQAKGGK
ncbi:TPA: P22AR C-terminal domain-containing protein [Haemophilus influenzae]|nr:P22AR C-terminal domain-containing protein [Haemophilus influenzae]